MSALDQYYKIKIISNAWQNHTLEFECSLDWNINQIKCYITHVYPRMQFNLFELTAGGRLMEPKQKLREILESRKSKQQLIFFIVLRQSMKFEDYYAERMKKFEQAIQQQYQAILGNQEQNSISYLPILNHRFQDFLKIQAGVKKLIPPPAIPNINVNALIAAEEQNNNGFGIFNLLRMVLFYTILVLVYYHGTFQQASIILFAAFVHYMVGNNGRRRRVQNNLNINNLPNPNNNIDAQNNPNHQKKEQNKQQKKGRKKVVRKQNKMKKLAYGFIQVLYCYLISLFPNWNVEDYLQKHKNTIQMRKAEIQQVIIFQNDEPETTLIEKDIKDVKDVNDVKDVAQQIIENKQA